MFKTADPMTCPSKVLIPGTRLSTLSRETNQTEDEENEDVGLPPEVERIVAHEDQEMGPHQEETELVNLGTGSGKREVKIGTGITIPIREELITLLTDYQDIFA